MLAMEVIATMELNIKSEMYHCPDVGNIANLRLCGPIDQKSVQVFEANILELYRQGICRLILDLSETKYLNSTGLGLLINIAHKVNVVGGGIKLINVAEKFKVLFDMLGLETCLPILSSYEEAVTSFGGNVDEMVPVDQEEEEAPEEEEEVGQDFTFDGLIIDQDMQTEEMESSVEPPEEEESTRVKDEEVSDYLASQGISPNFVVKEINDPVDEAASDEFIQDIRETQIRKTPPISIPMGTTVLPLDDTDEEEELVVPSSPISAEDFIIPESKPEEEQEPKAAPPEINLGALLDEIPEEPVKGFSEEPVKGFSEEPQKKIIPSDASAVAEKAREKLIVAQEKVSKDIKTRKMLEDKPEEKIPVQIIKRLSLVRYYSHMNYGKTYPMSIMLTKGKKSVDENLKNSNIIIVPRFPGCQVTPEKISMDISLKKAVCEFWLTPKTVGSPQGAIPAWIEVWSQGKAQEHFVTPFKIVRATWVFIFSLISFFFAIAGFVLDKVEYKIPTLQIQMQKMLEAAFQSLGGWKPLGVASGGFFLFFAIILYLFLREREAKPLQKITSLKMK